MSDALLASSVAGAFAAGMVAFFAPCCAGVMTPAYLAAVGSGRRLRMARLTLVYVAGVATVVLPITLGAAALAMYITKWHAQLFAVGGLMMLGVAVALWRGTMLPVHLPQPKLTGSVLSVFGLGVFSGAATACCAPVLVGAIALSATSGTLIGGLLLGAAYVAGMMAPLIPVALAVHGARKKLHDPQIQLRLGRHVKRVGTIRLFGVLLFAGFGALFIVLALTGNADTAPGFQKSVAGVVRSLGAALGSVPNFVAMPVLVLLIAGFVYALIREGRKR